MHLHTWTGLGEIKFPKPKIIDSSIWLQIEANVQEVEDLQ